METNLFQWLNTALQYGAKTPRRAHDGCVLGRALRACSDHGRLPVPGVIPRPDARVAGVHPRRLLLPSDAPGPRRGVLQVKAMCDYFTTPTPTDDEMLASLMGVAQVFFNWLVACAVC